MENKTRECCICGVVKSLNKINFRKYSHSKYYSHTCLECYSSDFRKSISGFAYIIYRKIVMSCTSSRSPLPTFTKDTLADWLMEQKDFNYIYEHWKSLNGYIDVNRIVVLKNHTVDYTINNLELISINEFKSRPILSGNKTVINKVNTKGDIVSSYESILVASIKNNIPYKSIAYHVLRGKKGLNRRKIRGYYYNSTTKQKEIENV